MARLPGEEDVGALPTLSPARGIASYDVSPLARSGQAMARSVAAVGEAMGNVANAGAEIKLASDRWDYAKAHADRLVNQDGIDTKFATDTNYATLPQRYEKATREQVQKSAALIPDGRMREHFMTATAPQVQSSIERMQLHAKGLEANANIAYTSQTGDSLIDGAVKNPDPASHPQAIQTYGAMVDGLVDKGFRTPEQALQMKRDFVQRFAHADVLARIDRARQSGDQAAIPGLLEELRNSRGTMPAPDAPAVSAPDGVIDQTDKMGVQYRWGRQGEVKGLIIHHTGGGGDVDGVIDTLKQRGLGAQYVIDREGRVHQLLPDNAIGRQIMPGSGEGEGLSNRNTVGVEVIARNDKDVLPVQVDAARKLAATLGQKYGFDPATATYGHGQVNPGHKEADEGATITQAIRGGGGPASGPTRVASAGGGPTPDTGGGNIYSFLRPDQRELLIGTAEAAQHKQQSEIQATFAQSIRDDLAEADRTGGVTKPKTPEQFLSVYGKDQGAQAYQEYRDGITLGADKARAATMTPNQQEELLSHYEPKPGPGYLQQLQRQQILGKAISGLQQELRSDPAGYQINHSEAVSDAYERLNDALTSPTATPEVKAQLAQNYAMLSQSEQRRMGIPAEANSVVPKSYANAINGRFAAAANSDDATARVKLVQAVRDEAAMWGSDWPAFMRQLAGSVSPAVRAIAAGADPVAMTRLLSLGKDEKPHELLKQQSETKAADLTHALNDEMAPYLRTLVGRQRDRDFTVYYDLGQKLGALYVRDGMSAHDAAAKAFNDLVGDRYDFRDTYRIPKSSGVSPDQVQAGATLARIALGRGEIKVAPAVDDAGLGAGNVTDSRQKFARDGRFVTSPDQAGLNLAYGDKFVRGADGKPLFLSWGDLAARGKDAPLDDAFNPVVLQ